MSHHSQEDHNPKESMQRVLSVSLLTMPTEELPVVPVQQITTNDDKKELEAPTTGSDGAEQCEELPKTDLLSVRKNVTGSQPYAGLKTMP